MLFVNRGSICVGFALSPEGREEIAISRVRSPINLAREEALVRSCDAIIIGAGPAGLATAAALQGRGLSVTMLEKSDAVGAVWRRHYDRLHLHTDRARSSLPGLSMPKAFGRYPSRAQVVEYLEAYAAKFNLRPVFNAPVRTVRRDGGRWRAEAGENSYSAPDRRCCDRLG